MSNPKVIIKVDETGARQTAKSIESVAKAQDSVRKASEAAAESLRKSSDSASRVAASNKAAASETQGLLTRAGDLGDVLDKKLETRFGRVFKATDRVTSILGQMGGALALGTLAVTAIAAAATAAVAGVNALAKALRGTGETGEAYARIVKAATLATDDYTAAIKRLPQAAAAATISQQRLSKAIERTTSRRAEWLSTVASAQDEIASLKRETAAAAAALKHAASMDEFTAANDRNRAAKKRLKAATVVLEYAQIRLNNAQAEHLATLDRATAAEGKRAAKLAQTAILYNDIATAAGKAGRAALKVALPGVGSAALAAADEAANKAFADKMRKRFEGDKAAAPKAARAPKAPAPEVDDTAALDLYREGLKRAQDAAAARTAIEEQQLDRERQLEQERFRMYADGVDARIAATKRERDAQVKAQTDMANAMVASGQAYAGAALSAMLYGGSISEAINATARAAFVEGTVGALGALAKAAVFSVINPPGVAPMLAAAKMYAAQAAVAGGIAAATGGISGGGGGGGSTAIAEPTPADFGEPERRERQDSEMFVNFASGQSGGRPISRASARAIIGALVDVAQSGGMRLETARA